MLFVFEKPGRYGFWMPDMHYPIDILWLDDQYSVVAAARSVAPESYPDTFMPPVPARYVLETSPGVIKGDFPIAHPVKN
jgi:hypothetical protein